MTDPDADTPVITSDRKPDDDATGISPHSTAVKEAWKRTNDDMEAIAEERRAAGWDVVTATAIHTSTVSKDMGEDEDDRFGLVHKIPGNHAEDLEAAFENNEFTRYEAYRNEIEQSAFLVTELQDPDNEVVALIAAHYKLQYAGGMYKNGIDEGELYTYAERVNGDLIGSYRHVEPKPLIPSPEELKEQMRIHGEE